MCSYSCLFKQSPHQSTAIHSYSLYDPEIIDGMRRNFARRWEEPEGRFGDTKSCFLRHVHKRQLDFKPELTLPVSRDSPRLMMILGLNRRPKLQLEVEPSITTFKLSVISSTEFKFESNFRFSTNLKFNPPTLASQLLHLLIYGSMS